MAADVEFGFVASAADAPGTPDHELYRTVLDDGEYHAELGYTTAWLIEHHFSDYFPTPSPLLLASHIAARFPELSLGTCVLVTPWYQPLRLAGEIAMLSLLTDQSLHLGLGRGTAKYEFDAFGLDMSESRQRFQEAWEILSLALRSEPFSYQGTYLQVPKRITVRPRVAGISSDRIHFYGAIGSPGSAEVMARLGLPPICTTIGDLDTQARILRSWESAAAASGTATADGTRPIMINCIVADTDAEAVRLAQEYMPRFMQAQVDHYTPDEVEWEKLES
jgi:alkanesulfonate monooxygenase SsuD/methylene tetrahydromethanopterin reductase-like flavin-dependent oxidoreductase (luciferase family)